MPTGMARWGFFTSSPGEPKKKNTPGGVREAGCNQVANTRSGNSHLTCGGDAVKAYEGIKTGGGTGKDPRPAERQESTRTEELL